jgi:hypothetical protein
MSEKMRTGVLLYVIVEIVERPREGRARRFRL